MIRWPWTKPAAPKPPVTWEIADLPETGWDRLFIVTPPEFPAEERMKLELSVNANLQKSLVTVLPHGVHFVFKREPAPAPAESPEKEEIHDV